MKTLAGALGLVAVAISSCGGGGREFFACVVGSGTTQVCIETETDVSDQNECGTGTLVDSCPRAGADGACVHVFAEAGPLTQRTWYYSGTAADKSQEMSACTTNGGTWLEP
ncbi:MAG TPA: hypothetical protein VN903_29705 [Polyangia bacterium]|jgi:hypothetical protein|nr:hypothetical protein [Polyangia bacterium]